MTLIIGLGNCGKEYENTRHNVGFMAVDYIINNYDFSDPLKKYKSLYYSGTIDGKKAHILKPQTLMNLSGIAVSELVRFYKIPLNEIYVIYDDLDLPTGKIRVRSGGGNGGHNGIKSIDEHIGNDYNRIKIGISRPENSQYDISSYVLGKISDEESKKIKPAIKYLSQNIDLILKNDSAGFFTKLGLNNAHKS